jgi:predicted  nucleic acid-binding Zn-ribbon protein
MIEMEDDMSKLQIGVVLGALALVAGCASPPPSGVDRAEAAAESMAMVRSLTNECRKQIDETLSALNAVSAAKSGNTKPAYEKFVAEIEKSRSLAGKTKATADAMRAKGRAFFADWEKEIETIKDPEMKARAQARTIERSKQYASIEETMGTAKGRWTTFSSDLKDLKTYLDNDLNAKGIESAANQFKKTNLDGTELKNCIGDLSDILDKVAAELAPGKK